jgi:GNAT superfamily N-acetyltransferase
MRQADVAGAERVTAEAFYALATHPANVAAPQGLRPPERAERWRRWAAHLLAHDGPGCWVAEDDEGLCGAATSLRREGLWGLASYAVLPRAQNAGVGRALLDAALRYSEGCLRGIICASQDARAVRRYRLAGFALHPAMQVRGTVSRATLPVVDGIRAGGLGDVDFCDSVDRRVRGSGHGVDHGVLFAEFRLEVCDLMTGSGYCYVHPSGGPVLLAATNRRIAQRLLWSSLATSSPDVAVEFGDITAGQQWALDVALAAGLSIYNEGYLCVRHMQPPAPYLPSSHFL